MEDNLMKIEKLIKKARNYYRKYSETEGKIFDMLSKIGIDEPEDIKSDAPNADDLATAITTYIAYDEYTLKEIMKEIKIAIK